MHVVDLFSHGKNREIGIPNSHELKTILPMTNLVICEWVQFFINRNTRYVSKKCLKTLDTLYQGTEGVA